MFYLLYISTPREGLDDSDFINILNSAHRNNGRNGVTGLLLACEAYFMQLLEGEQDAVKATYGRIIEDKRHRNPVILMEGESDSRLFSGWEMGFEYMNWLARTNMAGLSPILKSPEWKWQPEQLEGQPISCLDYFRRQFGVKPAA